jgi:starch synthase
MEGMAMGLPVVVTRVGGVPELVRDGVDGLLVPPSDPNAMADALVRVLADPVIASAMGRSGCARVHEKFGSRVSARVIARRLGIAVGSA